MTSNLGTQELQRQAVGFRQEQQGEEERVHQAVDSALKQTFRPEFLNRLDEIIIFHSLTEEHLKQVVDLLVKDVHKRLAVHKISLELTDAAKSWLVKQGYDPMYGARPLRRAIQRYIENPLSKRILSGEFKENDTIVVDSVDDELVFTRSESKVKTAV
jgi:ATP-dependent Clp protease ATP-binding subunit ClpC